MWWTKGVPAAIQACHARKSVLVVLVEPSTAITDKRTGDQETSAQTLSRVATSSMHSITFAHPDVKEAVDESHAVFLKFPGDEGNADYKAFSVFFRLVGDPPNLYFVSPTSGAVLMQHAGFVPVSVCLRALAVTTKEVSGRNVVVPDTKATARVATQLAAMQALPTESEDEVNKAPDSRNSPAHAGAKDIPASATRTESDTPPPSHGKRAPAKTKLQASRSMKLPSAGNDDGATENAKLLARMPDGTQARKTFSKTAVFSTVRSWLCDEAKASPGSVVISTAFPRRVFDQGVNPKMLSELGLFPSETLIVSMQPEANESAAQTHSSLFASVGWLRAYAGSVAGVIGGFFRSFAGVDNTASPDAGQEQAATGSGRGVLQSGHRSGAQNVMRIQQDNHEDDENLLSNGNSTQYGWNPRDEDEDPE